MITFFTVPKPFTAAAATSQGNAAGSWRRVHPEAEVILYGEEQGLAQAAKELGATHVAQVSRNEHGTPLLDSVFTDAAGRARHDVLCFLNADIVLLSDFAPSIARVAALGHPFLVVGESWDTDVAGAVEFAPGWEDALRRLPSERRGAGALDWFVHSRGLFGDVPPFAVGRIAYDNWLVWRARSAGALVVDATRAIHAVHQAHGYGHVPGGFEATRYRSEEGQRNLELVGDNSHLYTRFDATHLLTPGGIRRNWGATLRLKEGARKAVYKARHGMSRPTR